MSRLKELIIERSLKKKNAENPFDYDKAESFKLMENEDPLINNSFYFSAHSGEISIYFRLGLRSCHEENWFVIIDSGKKYALKKQLFDVRKSPIVITKEDDNYLIDFHGKLLADDGLEHDVILDATFKGKEKPIDFTTDMLPLRMARAIGQEKWGKDFFEELKNVQGQCHYEQEGTLSGIYSIDGEKKDFSLPCVRDHSFGKRDWNYMNNHLWIMAINENSQFNYSMVSYPAISLLEVGNFRDKIEKQKLLKETKCDLSLVSNGEVCKEFSLDAVMDDNSKVKLTAHILDTELYPFQDGEYLLYENVAEFDINGEKFKGIFEVGYNKDSSRYFNGKNVGSFKR